MYPDALIELFILAAYGLACAGLSALATWWLIGRRDRAAYRRGVRDTERLLHTRAIQERRDQTSARIPFA